MKTMSSVTNNNVVGENGVTNPTEESNAITMAAMVDDRYWTSTSGAIRLKIKKEQTDAVFAVLRYTAYYTFLFSTLATYVLWFEVPHAGLLLWYASVNAVALCRHWLCIKFEKAKPTADELGGWLRKMWFACVTVGLTWCALLGFSWLSTSAVVVSFIGVLLTILALGTFAALGFYRNAYLGAAIPQCLSVALIFWQLAHGYQLAGLMVIMALTIASMAQSSSNATKIWRSTMVLLHEHKELARQFQEKSAVLSTTLHSIGDGVLTIAPNGLVTYINPAAERLTGLFLQDVVGKAVTDCLVLADEAADGRIINLAAIFKEVRAAMVLPGELVLKSVHVTAVSVDVTISPLLYFPGSEVDGFVVTLHDVTLSRRKAQDLTHQALHDPLTGLMNRRGFEARLQESINRYLHDTVTHCLCYIDLDHFKAVNDTCGHQAGDKLLIEMVKLMRSRIRDSDSFARLGGDEFALLLRGCSLEKATQVATEICQSVAAYRFQWGENNFSIGASIGVIPMARNDSLKSIIEAADKACYQAKESGRGRVFVDSLRVA